MSSGVKPDKENQEHQTVSRKAVVLDSTALRTPLVEVNRQRLVGTDGTGGALKPGLPKGKQPWTSDCLPHRQSIDSHVTPLRNKAKESFRPSLPVMKGSECLHAEELLPVVSQSCPDMLIGDVPLPSISEASPEKLEPCLSPGDLPALSPQCATPASPEKLEPCLSPGDLPALSPQCATPASPEKLEPCLSPGDLPALSPQCATPASPEKLEPCLSPGDLPALSPLCATPASPEKLEPCLSPGDLPALSPLCATPASPEKLEPCLSHGDLPALSPLCATPASPEKLEPCLSPGDLPALSPQCATPASPELSLACEEGTPFLRHNLSCQTESDTSCGCEDLENEVSDTDVPHSHSELSVSDVSNCSVVSDEGVCSETDSPDRSILVTTCGLQEVRCLSPCTQEAVAESEKQKESMQAACVILEDILKAVEERVSQNQQQDRNGEDTKQITVDLPLSHGQTFLSEYARFVESYNQKDSPGLANTTGSLTDVTPFSQDFCEVESSTSSISCSAPSEDQLVVMDSMSSFLSDSDESASSTSTIHKHLAFEDRDTSPETSPNKWFDFVRSSESRFDLREHPEDFVPKEQGTERGDSAERDFLNLSISEQRVEFIALPRKLTSVGTSPINLQNQNQSCSSLMQDAQTMTVHAEPNSTPASPLAGDKSPVAITTPQVTHTNSVALSPMPVSVREQEANTSITETVEVDTMTQAVPTSEVALSPMVVARREMDTMTAITATTEVGMGTDQAEVQDHSMLATAEVDSKTTMTDCTGRRSVCTTMTPFKTMVKEGRRLTADNIRKQHPRALANQLETLTVANSRLESQALSAKQEQKRLQGALKEAKKLASGHQAELEAVDKEKEKEWKEKEKEQNDRCRYLEQLSQEQQAKVTSLEQELSALRAESEGTIQRQLEDLKALQEKCRVLEETHSQTVEQHHLQMEELQKRQEADSYHHQFERAQQMVREREAEVLEMRELFTDLQTTACKQEKIHSAYQLMHNKVVSLANENRSLRDSIASRMLVSREEVEHQQTQMLTLQEDRASLQQEVLNIKITMAVQTENLAELEKLYSVSSADLLIATRRVGELNSELMAAKKGLALQGQELEEQLGALQETEMSLRAALHHTQAQLQQQIWAHEKLQIVSQKMKKIYEDKLENMALGVENLQRTLDNREVDMNNLEKDLYECRNIILEQRYKIATVETDLREANAIVAAKKEEEEDIEFFRESNAFLEAERSVYVQSIRGLEEKLKASSLELTQQQQVAVDAEEMVEELQQDKLRLISELSHAQSQLMKACQAREEQERVESAVMASTNDLLQHMQLMSRELKKKIGLQEMPEIPCAEAQPPQAPLPSKPVKSRRSSRKSFVSSILCAITKAPDASSGAEQDSDFWESGSYLGEAMTNSVQKALSAKKTKAQVSGSAYKGSAVKEVTVTSVDPTFGDPGQSGSKTTEAYSTSKRSALSTGRRKLNFSGNQPLSVSWSENMAVYPNLSGSSAENSAHVSSSSLPSLSPSLHRPSSAVARVRHLPRTEYRSHSSLAISSSSMRKEGEKEVVRCVTSLKEVFSSISRQFSILDRATQLSLQDLREENDMLRERTEILETRAERNSAEASVCREEASAKDNSILQLQQQCQALSDQMMNLTDQKFHIKRQRDEMKRLEEQLRQERSEKEVLSAELNSRLLRLETSTHNDDGAALARCVRDTVTLKKKNLQLVMQLEEERDRYEEQGSKAARRMRLLDENWKKAEDELYRLDELVEAIKQTAQQSSSPSSDLRHILQLIE